MRKEPAPPRAVSPLLLVLSSFSPLSSEIFKGGLRAGNRRRKRERLQPTTPKRKRQKGRSQVKEKKKRPASQNPRNPPPHENEPRKIEKAAPVALSESAPVSRHIVVRKAPPPRGPWDMSDARLHFSTRPKAGTFSSLREDFCVYDLCLTRRPWTAEADRDARAGLDWTASGVLCTAGHPSTGGGRSERRWVMACNCASRFLVDYPVGSRPLVERVHFRLSQQVRWSSGVGRFKRPRDFAKCKPICFGGTEDGLPCQRKVCAFCFDAFRAAGKSRRFLREKDGGGGWSRYPGAKDAGLAGDCMMSPRRVECAGSGEALPKGGGG
nr:hypothetical protein CFP56_11462 [Quercus suber]